MPGIRKNTMGMFDCLKGMIILEVIMIHSFTEVWGINNSSWYPLIWRLIYASNGVAMGTLFIISGYGFRPIKSKKALKAQLLLLLKPYFTVFALCIICRLPLNFFLGQPIFSGALARVAGCLLGKMGGGEYLGIQVESIFVFWYFLALLFGWLLLTLIFRITEKDVYRGILVAFFVVLGYCMRLFLPDLPYCIVPTFLAMGFMYTGYLLKKKGWLFSKISPWLFAVLAIYAAFVLKAGNVNLSTGDMKLGLIDYMGTVCAGYVILRIYLWIFRPGWKIYTPFMFFGRNSYLIISIHAFEHLVFQWRSWDLLRTDSLLTTAFLFFVVRVLLILLIYFAVKQFQNFQKMWKRRKG